MTTLDKYAIISIIVLVILCIWHAIIGTILFVDARLSTINTNDYYVWVDRIVFFVLFGIYCVFHVAAIIWRYRVPLAYRYRMAEKDRECRNKIKLVVLDASNRINKF